MKKLVIILLILIVFLGAWSAAFNLFPQFGNYLNEKKESPQVKEENIKVVKEESITIDIVKKIGPSVVTIVQEPNEKNSLDDSFQLGPFMIYGLNQGVNEPQNIGSGFIVSRDGLVITSKHVVSDINVKYSVITNNDKKYKIDKIYKDPLNDIAILKINPEENKNNELIVAELGDSSKLEVGQFVIAMGTALGEFKNTVTTGVISGLGRGITAGSEFQGYVEKLDDVIQTDAAINSGNSGGPLINSLGQVIGINTAVALSGQNIGFALPINILKNSLKIFNESGQFERAYLGVSYRMVNKDLALLNDIVQGAYVQTVISNSPAEKGGIKAGDVIIEFDGKKVDGEKDELSVLIATKKAKEKVLITVWREKEIKDLEVILGSSDEQ